jgi:hypothetical protein
MGAGIPQVRQHRFLDAPGVLEGVGPDVRRWWGGRKCFIDRRFELTALLNGVKLL